MFHDLRWISRNNGKNSGFQALAVGFARNFFRHWITVMERGIAICLQKKIREKERSDPDLGRHLWESCYRYLHQHRLLSRFIGILCYSQASSLLIRTLFSLIELFLWSYNFLGGVFYLYDGKMASLMTSLNSRLERQQRRICIGETSAILYFAGWNKQKLWRLRQLRNGTLEDRA